MRAFYIVADLPEAGIFEAYFADMVTAGVLFYAVQGAHAAATYGQAHGYPVHALGVNARVSRMALATVQQSADLFERLADHLAPEGWSFRRHEVRSAAERGRLGGRPRVVDDATFAKIKADLKTATQVEVARRYGLKRDTLAGLLRQAKKQEGDHA